MFKNIFKWIKGWRLDKAFTSLKDNGIHVAIGITEGIKDLLNSGAVTFIADIASKLLPQLHDLPQEIIAELNKVLPKILAAELAVQGLPDNATEQDILDFENAILKAFSVTDNKSKLYTTLAAQSFGIIQAVLNKSKETGIPPTFAQLVNAVEEAYNDYLKDKADAESEAENN